MLVSGKGLARGYLGLPEVWLGLGCFSFFFDVSGQIITTSAEVTLNGGLVRESPQNPLNSGLGIIYTNLPRCIGGVIWLG